MARSIQKPMKPRAFARLLFRAGSGTAAMLPLPGRFRLMNALRAAVVLLAYMFLLATQGFSQPANDLFANRAVLVGNAIVANGSNIGATKESGEPDHAGNAGGKSVWWSW